mmetsp:Transcript_12942/g.37948  ORF Transcript_12942/g.37948 Transcript_12942/m.37948 type:complete len:251 (+) Transcript_12942:841-1593(+)
MRSCSSKNALATSTLTLTGGGRGGGAATGGGGRPGGAPFWAVASAVPSFLLLWPWPVDSSSFFPSSSVRSLSGSFFAAHSCPPSSLLASFASASDVVGSLSSSFSSPPAASSTVAASSRQSPFPPWRSISNNALAILARRASASTDLSSRGAGPLSSFAGSSASSGDGKLAESVLLASLAGSSSTSSVAGAAPSLSSFSSSIVSPIESRHSLPSPLPLPWDAPRSTSAKTASISERTRPIPDSHASVRSS